MCWQYKIRIATVLLIGLASFVACLRGEAQDRTARRYVVPSRMQEPLPRTASREIVLDVDSVPAVQSNRRHFDTTDPAPTQQLEQKSPALQQVNDLSIVERRNVVRPKDGPNRPIVNEAEFPPPPQPTTFTKPVEQVATISSGSQTEQMAVQESNLPVVNTAPVVREYSADRQAFRATEVKTKWTRVNPFANQEDSAPSEDTSPRINSPDPSQDSPPEYQDPSPQEDDSDVELPSEEDLMSDDGLLDDETLEDDFDDSEMDDEDERTEPRRRSTDQDFSAWPQKSIRETRVDIRDFASVVPEDRSYMLTNATSANWAANRGGQKVFAWVAPNIRYQPLYFEDIGLERYGETRGGVKQLATSGFHFFKSAALLPYSMVIDHPQSCEYPLGYCRPGNRTCSVLQRHWYGR